MLSVLMAGIYLFPIFTLASFYAMEHLPNTLFILVVLQVGWDNSFNIKFQVLAINIHSLWTSGTRHMLLGLSLILPLPDIITLVLCGVISAYTGLTFQPVFHSVLLWRLQIMGVISAIALTIASNSLVTHVPDRNLYPMDLLPE